MATLTTEQLADVFEKHAKWLRGEPGGERADLRSADLRSADLRSANLSSADLRYANLRSADLRSADLRSADLRYADLRSADLRSADLRSADLRSADLRSADLRSADLRSADLSSADLSSAENLTEAISWELVVARTRTAPPEGAIVGWKQCAEGVLVKVRVPEDSPRSNAFGRKCRAKFVDVLEVHNASIGISLHDRKTKYEVGCRVECDTWCEDFREECAGGIHFYITKEEAIAHL